MRSLSKILAIPLVLALVAVSVPSVALADGTCGTATEVAVTSGKLAKYDVNGDGIICQLGVKVLGKGNPKPSYADNG
jgi:hypothetical protein